VQHDHEVSVMARRRGAVERAFADGERAGRADSVTGIEQAVLAEERVALDSKAVAPTSIDPELRAAEGGSFHARIMARGELRVAPAPRRFGRGEYERDFEVSPASGGDAHAKNPEPPTRESP
jgi:hypothetical protein